MTTTTEAYIARPNGSIALEPVTYSPPAAHELLVEIVSASLCHTDVKAAAGAFKLPPPLILGHEAAGYVRAIGDNVDVKVGDAVVLSYATCGKCRRCVSGKVAYCDFLGSLNFSGKREGGGGVVRDGEGKDVNGMFFGQSSMGRMALVRERCAVKIEPDPGRDELKKFAALACGIQTGAGAILNIARPPPSSQIAVFGAGAVGLSAILATKLCSPTSSIYLIDNSSAKLDSLRTNSSSIMEGVVAIDSASQTSVEALASHIKSFTPNGRGVDVALDCVGKEAVTGACHAILDKCGLLLNIGSSAGEKAGFLLAEQLVRGITVRGTHQGDSVPWIMIPHLIELWKKGCLPFDRLLTEYKFEDLDKAIEDVKAGRVIKPLLVM